MKKLYPFSIALSLAALMSITPIAYGSDAEKRQQEFDRRLAMQITPHEVVNTRKAVEELQARLGVIKSFSSAFVQLTQDNSGNTLQRVEGMLQVAKPGKLRWKTEGIYEQLVVSDGASIWIYDADLEQVSIKDMDNRLSETPALLLGGDVSAIDEDFIISTNVSDSSVLYILQPKDTRQLFDALELRFNTTGKDELLTEMVIRDASGQVTQINFTDVKNNPILKDALFKFAIPDGVDVIDGRHGAY